LEVAAKGQGGMRSITHQEGWTDFDDILGVNCLKVLSSQNKQGSKVYTTVSLWSGTEVLDDVFNFYEDAILLPANFRSGKYNPIYSRVLELLAKRYDPCSASPI